MTLVHRPGQHPRPPSPRAAFNPPSARGFASRANPHPEDEPDETEPDAEIEAERAAERAQRPPIPLRPDGLRPGQAGMGHGHRPAAVGVVAAIVAVAEAPAAMATVAPVSPVAKAETTPDAPIAHVTPAADAVPPAPVAPARSHAAAPVAGLGLLTSQEAAGILRVSLQRLECWRRKGIGPAFIKINARTINYRSADIEAFLAARLQPGASA